MHMHPHLSEHFLDTEVISYSDTDTSESYEDVLYYIVIHVHFCTCVYMYNTTISSHCYSDSAYLHAYMLTTKQVSLLYRGILQ